MDIFLHKDKMELIEEIEAGKNGTYFGHSIEILHAGYLDIRWHAIRLWRALSCHSQI